MKLADITNMLQNGLATTMIIALGAVLIGVLIGALVAVVRVIPEKNIFLKIVDCIFKVYVSIFRGTPIMVQLLIFNFIIFATAPFDYAIYIAILVFGLNSGAYSSESIRAGIQSVDQGQMEAGRSLGLSYSMTMIKIILPQAIKNILPTMGNEFISLVKETSVVGFIGVVDLTKLAQDISKSNYDIVGTYLSLAVIYYVVVIIFTQLLKLLEGKLKKSDRSS